MSFNLYINGYPQDTSVYVNYKTSVNGNSYVGTIKIAQINKTFNISSSSGGVQFTGLEPGSSYLVEGQIDIYNITTSTDEEGNETTQYVYVGGYVSNLTIYTRPSPTTGYDGFNSFQKDNTIQSVNGLTSTVWNNWVIYLQQWLSWKNQSNYYSTYNNHYQAQYNPGLKVNSGDLITADLMNKAWKATGYNGNKVMKDITLITAQIFKDLANASYKHPVTGT